MSESVGHTAQETYWNQLVELKIVSCYVRRYRDNRNWWINGLGFFKAFMTSGTIAAWAIWKDHALTWGGLLAVSQVLDAGKDYLPQAKSRKAASEFVTAVEGLLIEARFEWHLIFNGDLAPDDIMARWRTLAKQLHEAESKYFPEGLPANDARQRLAEQDARDYFLSTYGVEGQDNG
jgi:hypothetical protein